MIRRAFLRSAAWLVGVHVAPLHDPLCSGLGCLCDLRLPPSLDRAALWYASHCSACGDAFPRPYAPALDAHGRPALFMCEVCKWHGSATYPATLPVPADWMR